MTDIELAKKTVRTTAWMVGGTALWLGALTATAFAVTGPSSADAVETSGDKASPAASGAAAGRPKSPPGHRSTTSGGKAEGHQGDPQ